MKNRARGRRLEREVTDSYLGTEALLLAFSGTNQKAPGDHAASHTRSSPRTTGNPVGDTCPPVVPTLGWFPWLLAWGNFYLSSSFRSDYTKGAYGPKGSLLGLLPEKADK